MKTILWLLTVATLSFSYIFSPIDRINVLTNRDMVNSQQIELVIDEEKIENAYIAFLNEVNNRNDNFYYEFALRDIDGNGVIELILKEFDKDRIKEKITVYSFDNDIFTVGCYSNPKESFTGGFHCSTNTKYPGLFEVWWGGGIEHYGYLSMNSKSLEYKHLLCIDRSVDPPDTYELTDDKYIISETYNLFPPYEYEDNLLQFYSINVDSFSYVFYITKNM